MDEEDRLLTQTLKNLYEQILEERADIKRTDEANSKITAEYDEAIERLSHLLKEINEVIDIYRLEEEDFVFVIEALELYCDNFIVDGRTETARKRDEKEYNELKEFLDQFYDDDDDDLDEEEDFDEETEEDE